jgi:CheY-like chemotaxis protein
VSEGTGTILIVDDEEVILEVGAAMLEELGYTVFKATGGKEALEILRDNVDIDMVLLDMVMPDMGGGDTFDEIKRMAPDVKVLLSSGYSIDGEAKEILERGCNGFIQKPFDMSQLSKKVKDVMETHKGGESQMKQQGGERK